MTVVLHRDPESSTITAPRTRLASDNQHEVVVDDTVNGYPAALQNSQNILLN